MSRVRGLVLFAGGVFLVVAVAITWAVMRAKPDPPPPPPTIDTTGMEPLVGQRIIEARGIVLLNPRSGSPWGRLGRVLHAHDRTSDAAECYVQAGRLEPSEFAWPYLASAALEGSEPEQALKHAHRALDLNADFMPLQALLGHLHELLGRPDRAMLHYERAREIDDRCAAAHLGLGRLALASGDLESARAHLERAAELQPRSGLIRGALAQLYHRDGDTTRAEREAAQARELIPRVHVRDPLMDAVRNEAVSSSALFEKARVAEARGDDREAVRLYREALAVRPDKVACHYNCANALLRLDDVGPAEAGYRQALRLDPDHLHARINLGMLLVTTGRVDESKAEFEAVLDRSPGQPDALQSLGRIHAMQRDLDRAATLLRQALAARPDDGEVHHDLAQVLAALGDRSAALRHAAAAVRLGHPLTAELRAALQKD